MIALIQRVTSANVSVDAQIIGQINRGIVVFLGVEQCDDESTVTQLCHRVLGYRIFGDNEDKMNLSLTQINGELLVVSQFTLVADTRKGMRPSFSKGASQEKAQQLYHSFVSQCKAQGVTTETGRFAANMQVALVNDGPVTFSLTV